MPEQFNNYYEPFLGSGAVLAQLLYLDQISLLHHFNHAYASDTLPFLIDIFNIVKNDPQSLINYYNEQISAYYISPDECYKQIRDRFNKENNPYDFCLLSRTCYSGVIRFRKADGYMSTPRGPHSPIKPKSFEERVILWNSLIQKTDFLNQSFNIIMDQPTDGDVVYCDPPYTHSQNIIYGAQGFKIEELWQKIFECKQRGAKVLLSINGSRESKKKDISVRYPEGLFVREIIVDCGTSMIDRLQSTGSDMADETVHDKLLLTW